MDSEKLSVSSPGDLFLSNRKQENCRQNNDGADPETGGHFVHVAKKYEGHDDAVYRLEVGDKSYPEGRKLAHYRHSGNVSKRRTDSTEKQKVANIGTVQDHRFVVSADRGEEDGDPNKGAG